MYVSMHVCIVKSHTFVPLELVGKIINAMAFELASRFFLFGDMFEIGTDQYWTSPS